MHNSCWHLGRAVPFPEKDVPDLDPDSVYSVYDCSILDKRINNINVP